MVRFHYFNVFQFMFYFPEVHFEIVFSRETYFTILLIAIRVAFSWQNFETRGTLSEFNQK